MFRQGPLSGADDARKPGGAVAGVRVGPGRGRGQLHVHGQRAGQAQPFHRYQADRDQ